MVEMRPRPGTVPFLVRALGRAVSVTPLLALLAGCGDVTICSDFDDTPPNCEICSNRIDDDLDGDTDCRDSECRDVAFCRDENLAVTTSTMEESAATGTATIWWAWGR
jgi:hypothetical protein